MRGFQPKHARGKPAQALADGGLVHSITGMLGMRKRTPEEMLAADAMILGTPCYFTDMSAEMKALVDRAGFVAFVNGGLFQGKIGAAVVAAGRGGATHAFDSINHMFLMSRMIVPGSTYWNMGYGSNEKDVLNDSYGMENMNHLGRTIAWLGKATAPHLASFPV